MTEYTPTAAELAAAIEATTDYCMQKAKEGKAEQKPSVEVTKDRLERLSEFIEENDHIFGYEAARNARSTLSWVSQECSSPASLGRAMAYAQYKQIIPKLRLGMLEVLEEQLEDDRWFDEFQTGPKAPDKPLNDGEYAAVRAKVELAERDHDCRKRAAEKKLQDAQAMHERVQFPLAP